MNDDARKITIEFENNATKLFSYLYNQFDIATHYLDRQKDENVFQQSAAQYTFAFKQQLTIIALRLIEDNKLADVNSSSIQLMLTQQVEKFVNEFRQKTKKM